LFSTPGRNASSSLNKGFFDHFNLLDFAGFCAAHEHLVIFGFVEDPEAGRARQVAFQIVLSCSKWCTQLKLALNNPGHTPLPHTPANQR
jgi:hypothetical protein